MPVIRAPGPGIGAEARIGPQARDQGPRPWDRCGGPDRSAGPGRRAFGRRPICPIIEPVTRSAGLLLFRHARRSGPSGPSEPWVEVLIAHPGGPLWSHRDDGAWSVIKGEIGPGEEPIDVARREFREETGSDAPTGEWIELGEARQKGGKVIEAWAAEGDFDPETLQCMTFELEWPPRSGRRITVPEIDRVAWSSPDAARRRLNPAQGVFVDRLLAWHADPARQLETAARPRHASSRSTPT